MKERKDRYYITLCIGSICLVLMAVIAIGAGQFHIPFNDAIKVLIGIDSEIANYNVVIRNVRLPRIIISVLAGAGLAVSGASFQAIFSNPLATPDSLGSVNGASFGAAIGILLGLGSFGIQISALISGMFAVFLVFVISQKRNSSSQNMIMLVLAGMVISSLFSSLVTLVKYVADPTDVLPVITFWLMGSFSSITMKSLISACPFICIGVFIIYMMRYRLNVLSLHEQEAYTLGIPVKLYRTLIIIAASMISASIVSVCGVISWVGLLIPHLLRMIVGNDNRKLIPCCIIYGGLFLLITDTIARTLTSAEIPVSLLTSIIGAPVFIMLLRKTGGIRV